MSGVQELHLFEIKSKVSATKKRYYTATQFSLYFIAFSRCSILTSRYYTLRAVEKTPIWLQSAAPATEKTYYRPYYTLLGAVVKRKFCKILNFHIQRILLSCSVEHFSCNLQHFHGVVSQPQDTTRSALWKKRLTGFKVLHLPRKNVLHAPGCDKMAILDHGEVLPQTLLHARRW